MKMRKKLLSFLVAFAMLAGSIGTSGFTVNAANAQTEETNLAAGRTVTVSSVEALVAQNTGDKAVDGISDADHRWSSEKMKEPNATDADPQTAQWLTINLGIDAATVNRIQVDFHMKVWATKYQIQTADTNTDDTEWTTIGSIDRQSENTSGISDIFDADSLTSTTLKRYVRFYFEKINVNAAGTGVSVTEITIMGTPAAEPEPEEATNVALGKTVSASSVETAVPENIAANAVDGNPDTRWSCNAMKNGSVSDDVEQTPQWLTIDLSAESTSVTELRVAFFKKVWASQYRIETADTNDENTEWTTVKEIPLRAGNSLEDYHTDTFNDITTLKRYVRFYFEKVNGLAGGTGVSVTEITIMGTQTGIIPPDSGEGEDPAPTYSRDFTTNSSTDGMEVLYGNNVSIEAAGNNSGLKISYGSSRAGVVDKQMPQTADGIFEATLVPQQNVGRFGLILRATDENHKIYVGTENSSNRWFWEYWGDNGQKWGTIVTGPALTANQEARIKIRLVGNQVTLWVNDTEVFSQKMNAAAPLNKGYFGFDKSNSAGSYLIKNIKMTEIKSASGIINSISALPQIQPEDTSVQLPPIEEGYSLKVIGSSKEQVISNDGTICSRNIGDREVSLILEAVNNEDPSDTARRNFTVTVPSKTANYPEALFPSTTAPNKKPSVIPTLQEWYGGEGQFTLSGSSRIVINDAANIGLSEVAENMKADLKEITGLDLPVTEGTQSGGNDIYIEALAADTYETGEEGYFMTVNDNGVKIYAPTYTGCLYGTITAEQILWQDDAHKNIPHGVIRDYPDYEIRGLMFDVARIPHRIQYLRDYTKILTWYKMNEFHLHLNDDFNYNPNALPNHWEPWTGLHRLENDAYPSLTKKRVYADNDYFNQEYADPFYTKDEYKALESLANSRGIDLIAEFDTPSHSTAYSEYAKENPDKIEWLNTPINSINCDNGGTKGQMLALDINSSNEQEKQRALTARKFIETLYADYLAGDDPTFKSDTVHVGADEYWDKSNPEAFRSYTNFLADLMKSYGKTARMWGAQKMFPGTTPIDPSNIVLDVWATYEEDPIARMQEGFRVVNVPQPYLYVTPGRNHKDMVGEEYLFKNWDPTIFNADDGTIASKGEPLLLGAKTALWGDEFREGMTEADLHERMLRAAAITAQKTWGGQEADDSYIEYQMAFEDLQEGPGTEIAHHIDSVSEVITDYDLSDTEETADGLLIRDKSGNGYDALVTNGELVTVDGKKMVKFSGNTLMTTPLKTLDYPYTISFDVKAANGNTANSLLFNGYDGQLRAADKDGQMTVKRSFYTQNTGYTLPTDKTATVTIVGSFQNTKIYVDGELVKMLHMTSDAGDRNQIPDDSFWSTFVFPMEEIGENFHGYIGNIKTWNKALPPEMFAGTEPLTEINVALNAESYAERFGNHPGLNTGDLKRHPSWKATDGDKADPDSYWLSSNSNNDYLMTDLGENKTISKVTVTWDGNRYATSFAIEVSADGETWERVKAISGNTASENVITLDAPKEARFVKVQGISRNAQHYAIRELEVFEKVKECPHTETTLINAKKATCTENGYTGDTVCNSCGKTIETGKIINAKGHRYGEWVVVKEPTETADGLREKTCEACGDKVQETIDKLPACKHDETETVGKKEATCTEDGYSGDTVCTSCGKTIEKGKVIKAKGHNYGKWVVVKEPTETADGLREKTCEACGDKVQETIDKLPACKHDQTKTVNAKNATCTQDGYTGDTVCNSCGKTLKKGEAIKAKGHSYGEATIVKKPTSAEEGLLEKTCSSCGLKIQETIPKLPADTSAPQTNTDNPVSGNNSAATGDPTNVFGILTLGLFSLFCIYEIRRKKMSGN